jgi:hypothetical protein
MPITRLFGLFISAAQALVWILCANSVFSVVHLSEKTPQRHREHRVWQKNVKLGRTMQGHKRNESGVFLLFAPGRSN